MEIVEGDSLLVHLELPAGGVIQCLYSNTNSGTLQS